MRRIDNFRVFSVMCNRGSQSLKLAPLGNIRRMNTVKGGAQITIYVPRDVMDDLACGDCVGGLIVASRAEFIKIKAELESSQGPE